MYFSRVSSASRPENSAGTSYSSHWPTTRSASGVPAVRMRHASAVSDSSVRTEVVPTAVIRPHFSSRRATAARRTSKCSVCIGCRAASSSLTGKKVPAPTCSVTSSNPKPRAFIPSISSGVKCSPAVGAATDPSNLE